MTTGQTPSADEDHVILNRFVVGSFCQLLFPRTTMSIYVQFHTTMQRSHVEKSPKGQKFLICPLSSSQHNVATGHDAYMQIVRVSLFLNCKKCLAPLYLLLSSSTCVTHG